MSFAGRATLAAAVLAVCAAPAAEARLPEAGAASLRPETFRLARLHAPASAQAGASFTASGRVRNLRGSRRGTGRLTFTLQRVRGSKHRWYLRAHGTRKDRNSGPNVGLTRGGHARRFVVRLRVPAAVPAAHYRLRACVRRGSGTLRGHCRSRRVRVWHGPGSGNPGGGGSGSGGNGLRGLRSLRAPLTGENFYFVMADRFENGSTANDHGGLPPGRLSSGYDDTHKGFYHGGDLAGLRQHLDYIQGLGTTSIWLTPSFKNKPVQGPPGQETAGYHGYWITDFTSIDPHLGTNAELAGLIADAHARGMKVFFDIITNHTADVITYAAKPGGPAPYGYVSKDQSPYRDDTGAPFDDRDYAGGSTFPALSASQSFPFTPSNPADSSDPASVNHKVPEWLNDVTAYHNRGDTTFTGENAYYGDFFGLDDLFTEQPRVLQGMIDIYQGWIRDFGIDGFRIDTMKHVNDEFWQRFAPEVLSYAKAHGKPEFLLFGEVFDLSRPFQSHFTTHDRVQSVLDFPFQAAAQRFAASSGPGDALRDFFAADDWYTDADSNVYQLPTFLGNHDMGRIGFFLRGANPGATDQEIFQRDRLAHELMYFSRGNPVIYYGDEQGFVGDGGDQDARQDMFGSHVASYNDDDLIATDATTATPRFDTSHPVYSAIAALARVTRTYPALRNGPAQYRYSTPGAGIYAFSRLDRSDQREYVVALNNSEQEQTAFVPTSSRSAAFHRVYGDGGASVLTTDAARRLPVVVPALSAVVYRSDGPIARSGAAPDISIVPLPDGGVARDRAEIRAFVDGSSFYDVTFEARVGGGDWTPIGTDDNSPYRVFHDISDVPPGTTISYRAIVLDNAGHTAASETDSIVVAEPSVTLTAPPDGGKVRNHATLTAEVVPDHNDSTVTFERSVEGGPWTTVATDSSQPAYTADDDITALAGGTALRYRAVLTWAPGHTVTSAPHAVTISTPVTTAVIHYQRTDGNYAPWGLHLWGDGLAAGEASAGWTSPKSFEGTDAYGAFHSFGIADDTKQVGFIVHGKPPNENTKDTDNDRFFTPIDHPEIWLKQGDATIYFSPPG
jgi:alpha-amylase